MLVVFFVVILVIIEILFNIVVILFNKVKRELKVIVFFK